MPKTCSVCEHELRTEIDAAIVQGGTSRAVAERFGLSKPTITGHRRSGHHHLQTPHQRDTATPHDAASLLRRIEECRGDHEAIGGLRIAVSALPAAEKRLFIAGLRRRAGRVAVVAEAA